MPFGEMLMENTNLTYDNPYKYNAKEFDMATGYYYYGARYYDPRRSVWLSVDPLADITNSPYAYVWNDPVNFADPTGMMGERVGGNNPCDPPAKRSFVRRTWDTILGWFKGKPHGKITVGMPTSSREPDQTTQNTLPWYLNKGKYGGKPILTLGAHNIVLPYMQRDGYNSNVLENGSVFVNNTISCIYNGIASTWNEGMQGKEGSAMLYEGDNNLESAVRRITRGTATPEEFELLAAAVVTRKAGGEIIEDGKVIGLGLDEDLYNHRGTGAITWKDAQWQKAGLTTVSWAKVVMDKYKFRYSFTEAAENASGIRFDVTNFNPTYHKQGMTNFEFNHILSNPALLQKTTFIKGGNKVIWNGTQFINK